MVAMLVFVVLGHGAGSMCVGGWPMCSSRLGLGHVPVSPFLWGKQPVDNVNKLASNLRQASYLCLSSAEITSMSHFGWLWFLTHTHHP